MKIDNVAVRKMFDNYHQKVGNGKKKMYHLQDGGIQVVLDEAICWTWANSASGTMGEGNSKRPVGIRLSKSEVNGIFGSQNKALKKIFNSTQDLRNFIKSSDCANKFAIANKIVPQMVDESTSYEIALQPGMKIIISVVPA
jgi:hypothetical protein